MRVVIGIAIALAVSVPSASAAQGNSGAAAGPPEVDCSRIHELGLDKQSNLHAAHARAVCGLEAAGRPATTPPTTPELPQPVVAPANVNTITGTETYPKVTQSESVVWSSNGSVIVVNYNDSSASPQNYAGASRSTDGGTTFTRILPTPFTGHGTNYGDPILVYNQNLGKWFAGDLVTGCGGQGIGLWTSTDGLNWSVGACAHSGISDDRDSMWVDNTGGSFDGRMYISWNDFAVAGQPLSVTYSDDGVTWSAPVRLTTTFVRNVQLTGGPDGTVFVAGMNEGGGGFFPRTNMIYRSLDGGATWTQITMGAPFAAVGDSYCSSYFAQVNPIWRHMGWGQPGVGPGGIVHYAYAGKGVNTNDTGDIYYTRSSDNGATWSTPIVLNTDQATGGTRTQWMPSLSVTSDGGVHVYWYDRRNTTNGSNYEVWGRQSTDNGATWLPDSAISSVLIPQPAQPDPNVQACYAGDYNYATAFGGTHYAAWTDGRVSISGVAQQDVFFAAVPASVSSPDFGVSLNPSSLTIQQGSTGLSTTTVSSLGGFSGVVGLSCSGQPAGITCGFVPSSVNPPSGGTTTSQLTVNVDAGMATGNYAFSVVGASGSLTHSAAIAVEVTAPSTGDFSIVCNQSNLNVSRTFTKASKCSVRSQGGFSAAVSLSCAGLPSGASCGFQPASVTPPPNGAANFTMTVSGSNVAAGQYQFQVVGTSGSLVRSEAINLKVKP